MISYRRMGKRERVVVERERERERERAEQQE